MIPIHKTVEVPPWHPHAFFLLIDANKISKVYD